MEIINDSVLIGKDIYDCLKEILTNVFPIVAEEGTQQPFIVYNRDNLNLQKCIDGTYQGDVSFTVNIVTNKYQEGLQIASQVIDKIFRKFNNTRLTGFSEQYSDNGYVQTLNFNIEII